MSKKRVRSRLIGYRGFKKGDEFDRNGNVRNVGVRPDEDYYKSDAILAFPHIFRTLADCKSAGAKKCVPVFDRNK